MTYEAMILRIAGIYLLALAHHDGRSIGQKQCFGVMTLNHGGLSVFSS